MGRSITRQAVAVCVAGGFCQLKRDPVAGARKKDFKSSGLVVGRRVDHPVGRRRPVDRPGRASGSAVGAAGRPSGRRLAADRLDRLVGFADWTSITPCV